MSLDVFFPQDVARVLAALASAGELQGSQYQKALGDVALAFGLEVTRPWAILDARKEVQASYSVNKVASRKNNYLTDPTS